ncbi:sensor histidine kinase [Zobellia laminariae]|uniref:sensor histidine kinase n=1 Tax=Zobellia laminariae TaxID=248906 RepID=UPI0026F413C6|nr:histidine kinase dimerization/phosphoacceptor domain -containing protein [Zobellia laminariae]WKX75672.1 histidine kinase dimerization/phosphoacceptor domain -containing protein [Zobellia laminariae]
MNNIYYKNTIFIWAIFFLSVVASAQKEKDKEENLFQQFQDFETPDEKLTFFFNAQDLYRETSTYDWLDLVNLYLNAAIKDEDSAEIERYKLIQARIYYDLGDYDKSLAISKELYAEKEDLDIYLKSKLLDIMDDNYGQLTMYTEQIEIRKEQRELGINENVAFYDIYANLGMYRKAMEHYIDNVKKTIEENDFYAQAEYYNNLGNYLRLDESAPTALSHYKKAKGYIDVYMNLITRKKSEEEIEQANLLRGIIEGNIGKCHVDLKQYKEAIPHLESAINTLKKYKTKDLSSEITENSLAISECYLQLEDYGKATDFLSDNLETKTTKNLLRKNRLFALYYDRTEDYKNASIYLKKNIRVRDSVLDNQSELRKQQLATVMGQDLAVSQTMLAEQKLALEKSRVDMMAKERNINLVLISLLFTLVGFAGLVYAYLKSIKNQRLIAEQKYIIENALVEKDSLLKEIHHRVKNNLQMVSSLLSLQTKNTRSKAAIEALEEGKSRVKAMALIHQKLYQNEDLSVIEMQSYIESLINSVQSVYKKGGHNINITVDAEGVELDIDRAIPFGLMLNELVSNSFKYAFPDDDENGKIYIHIRKIGEKEGYFEYSDNGIGLPEDTDERANSSMGIRLMNRLANQLQTTLNIDKTAEDGVRYWFNFS